MKLLLKNGRKTLSPTSRGGDTGQIKGVGTGVAKNARHREAADKFLEYLASDGKKQIAAQKILDRVGYKYAELNWS